jgi:hypothetical protein
VTRLQRLGLGSVLLAWLGGCNASLFGEDDLSGTAGFTGVSGFSGVVGIAGDGATGGSVTSAGSSAFGGAVASGGAVAAGGVGGAVAAGGTGSGGVGVSGAGVGGAAMGGAGSNAGSGGAAMGGAGSNAGSGGAAMGGAGSNAGSGGTPMGGAGGSAAGMGGAMAGTAGSSAGTNAGGTGGQPNTDPTGITVTTTNVDVQGKGTVFNVADDYFNDGFIPATPVANFGCHSQITTAAADDGSLDIAWLDYANGKGRPWAVSSPGTIFITHLDANLGNASTQSTGLSSYKLLGFARDGAGAFYVAYNKDHALKGSGGENNLNGNELHVAKISAGSVSWDQLVFGNQDNNAEDSLGDPGGAASGVLGYEPTNQRLLVYVGHSMMWGGVRHQAGFLRLLNPSTGAVINPPGNDIIHFGAGWWYSHNFNQRLLVDGGYFYVLAHGDAYDRQLGFARWSASKYASSNATDFNQSDFGISGNVGDNNTNAQTGQLVRGPSGKFVIVHTTSQGRTMRDVRVVAADGNTGVADANGARWLTSNQGTVHATIAKVEVLGEHLLVTYALWDTTKKHELVWYATLLDASLQTVAQPKLVPNVEFVDAAPLFRFKAGPNAGKVGWVSGNASHTLSVRVASLRYD